MVEPILFGDAAALTITFLRAALASHGDAVPVVGAVPSPRPDRFVTVQLAGGQRDTLVSESAQLNVECWGLTTESAHDLVQLSRAFLHAMAGAVLAGVQCYQVTEFASPAALPDPLSAQPRFVLTVLVALRGTAI